MREKGWEAWGEEGEEVTDLPSLPKTTDVAFDVAW